MHCKTYIQFQNVHTRSVHIMLLCFEVYILRPSLTLQANRTVITIMSCHSDLYRYHTTYFTLFDNAFKKVAFSSTLTCSCQHITTVQIKNIILTVFEALGATVNSEPLIEPTSFSLYINVTFSTNTLTGKKLALFTFTITYKFQRIGVCFVFFFGVFFFVFFWFV